MKTINLLSCGIGLDFNSFSDSTKEHCGGLVFPFAHRPSEGADKTSEQAKHGK